MQQFLDIRTLSFITGATALAMFICMAHTAQRRRTYPGFDYWRMAFLANCLGLVAMSTRNVVPDAVSILLAHFMNLAAPILICRGLTSFSGGKPCFRLGIGAEVSLMALLAYFTYVDYDVRLRTGFIVLWMAFFYLRAAFKAGRPVALLLGRANGLLTFSLAACGLWLIFYGLTTWIHGGRIPDLMSAGALHGLNLMIYQCLSVMIMVGLISINSTRLENDLVSAKEEIQELQGFLPICANCKKIRDDQGYWQQVETYISDNIGAEMTHSICPDCAAKLYPELAATRKKD